MLADAKRAGYPPVLAGAPSAIAHAEVTPAMAVNEVPRLVEWKSPVSVLTHTSPVTDGLTITLTGDVEVPRDPLAAKVLPPSTER